MKYLATLIIACLMAMSAPAFAQHVHHHPGWGVNFHIGPNNGGWRGVGPWHNPAWRTGPGWWGGRYWAPGTGTCWVWNGFQWVWSC